MWPSSWLWGLLLAALVLSGCGGGQLVDDGGEAASPAGAVVSSAQVGSAVDTIVADWGDRDGFAVTIIAVDAGYSIAQIVDHPSALTADGRVEGIEPVNAGLGLIGDPRSGEEGAAAGVELVDLAQGDEESSPADRYVEFVDETLGEVWQAGQDHLEEAAGEEAAEEDFETAITQISAILLARGYAPDRVIEALFLGEVKIVPFTAVECSAGIVVDGQVVAPSGEDLLADECTPLAPDTTDDEDDDDARDSAGSSGGAVDDEDDGSDLRFYEGLAIVVQEEESDAFEPAPPCEVTTTAFARVGDLEAWERADKLQLLTTFVDVGELGPTPISVNLLEVPSQSRDAGGCTSETETILAIGNYDGGHFVTHYWGHNSDRTTMEITGTVTDQVITGSGTGSVEFEHSTDTTFVEIDLERSAR